MEGHANAKRVAITNRRPPTQAMLPKVGMRKPEREREESDTSMEGFPRTASHAGGGRLNS